MCLCLLYLNYQHTSDGSFIFFSLRVDRGKHSTLTLDRIMLKTGTIAISRLQSTSTSPLQAVATTPDSPSTASFSPDAPTDPTVRYIRFHVPQLHRPRGLRLRLDARSRNVFQVILV